MTKKKRFPDTRERQLNLPFSNLRSFDELAGSYSRKSAVQEALKRTLRDCQLSREEIADEMSRLVSEKITVNHIANWTAESKNGWRMPLEYAAAFFVITGDDGVVKAALSGSGIGIMDDREYAFYELGKIVAEERQRSKKKRRVMEELGL
jgi:hypothetical protein